MWAQMALHRLRAMLEPGSRILDIGAGMGEHAVLLEQWGFDVLTLDRNGNADLIGDYIDLDLGAAKFEAIWASHVLEHQRNVGLFLDKCWHELVPDGVLAVTVPPLKPELVGGHLSLWTQGHLVYNLILAGFDCSKARVFQDGYNCSALVRKTEISLPALRMDSGDIKRLQDFFPPGVTEGMSGWEIEQK